LIRINLLEERAPQRGGPSISVPSLPQENLLFYVLQAAIPILVVLVVGGMWFMNSQAIGNLNDEIRTLEEELKQLRAVIELNKRLEAKRDLLRRKISVITNLKRNQDVPVRMLDHLSRNLSEFLWLGSLKVNNRSMTLQGFAQNEYAHSQFMRNLQNSEYFERIAPKDLIRQKTLYRWTLSCLFVLPEEKAAAAQAAKTGP